MSEMRGWVDGKSVQIKHASQLFTITNKFQSQLE